MINVLLQAIRWVNLPYTLLLSATGVYWIIVILGFLDIEVFDIGLDLDLDLDADMSFGHLFSMLNVGSIPFSIWASIFILQMWVYSIVANMLLDAVLPSLSNLLRFLLCALLFIPLAAFMSKVFTNPLKSAFEGRESTRKSDFVGKECLVTSSQVTTTFGTAQITLDGVPQLIDIRAKADDVFKKGDTALIYSYDEERDVFYITSM